MSAANEFTQIRYEEESPTVFYVGKAVPGKQESEQAWLIVRYTLTGTGGVKSEYAKGGQYTYYPWTDRASLIYE